MLKITLLTSLLMGAFLFTGAQQHAVSYDYNRAPLTAGSNVQLPLGSIRAKGWLLKQLELQRDGATGHAEALYPEADNLGPGSDWLGGKGSGWERVPYYVKGLIALAYTLDDAVLKERALKWIRWTLDNQHADGSFGPEKMKDWWPRMPMMYAIQSYYEATGDEKVIPFFTRYFRYQLENLDKMPLYEWSKSRTADNIELVFWLYNKTGDQLLLALAQKLDQQAYPWANIYTDNAFYYQGDDFHTKHSVSVGQALKFPVVYGQLNHSPLYQQATAKGINHLIRDHGLAGIIASGTEFLSGKSSFQGVETCTVVEWMQSLETASRITQDAATGDRLEKIAFNVLPAQFSRDIRSHLYYTQPNQLFCKHGNSGFDEDYDGGILLSPYSGMGCCRYNMHMGWPYFVKNSWAATPDKGLAVIAYAPVEVNAVVAGSVPVKLNVETNYPFEEQIRIGVNPEQPAAFPLKLRIPEWCAAPEIKVNSARIAGVKKGSIFVLSRTWKKGDQIILNFPMKVIFSRQLNNSVTVARGPLVYSLKIDADYSIRKEHPVKGFFDYEVRPASAWNYALIIDRGEPAQSVSVQQKPMPENPFEQATTPVTLKLKAKRLPFWKISDNEMHAEEVPSGPVTSDQPVEEVTLTPYGSENIRISNFPVIGPPKPALKTFREDFTNGTLNNWVNYGQWFIKDGAIHSASNKGSWGYGIHGVKTIPTNVHFGDLSYEATVKLSSGGNAGLIFRVSGQNLGADAYNGYYVGIDVESGKIQLGKASARKWTLLKEYSRDLRKERIYHIRIEARGERISVYFEHMNKPIISVTDNEFSSGTIGLRSYDCLATIDNLNVKAL
ncbi:beta-L-arabinofuranosidase domain-containing protein [Pedobacter sp. JY14-1]|uniref:beta-L-arabinofuranosidase domain-containing protein n=1 Tax=Pedobacter sp. JY14-1 TaxID=3034151 RepID=UPI0023E20A57|nr:beta-L-arabinofuranosidase domain-containing protein [Pedobacter sp. JY14-1]